MFTLSNFYKSKEWTGLINTIKANRVAENGFLICEHCKQNIVKKYDCIAHHKEELTEQNVNDYNISLNEKNIILVHHKCHNEIHKRFGYANNRQQIFIVWGSPCAGKTSYVKKIAMREDIILDIDKIYEMISVNERYIKPNAIKRNVFGLRDCLLEQIKYRLGFWKNAYIIGTYPFEAERERLVKELNATTIHIDTPKEECILNATKKPKEWLKYIEEYWERYTPHIT